MSKKTEQRTRPVLRKWFDKEMSSEVETFTAPDTPYDDPVYVGALTAARDAAQGKVLKVKAIVEEGD
jgi:hypothetical protein